MIKKEKQKKKKISTIQLLKNNLLLDGNDKSLQACENDKNPKTVDDEKDPKYVNNDNMVNYDDAEKTKRSHHDDSSSNESV